MLDIKRKTPLIALVGAMALMASAPAFAQDASAPAAASSEAAPADAAEIAWRCVEASPVWYRIAVLDEPPFPLSLSEADHTLERLNTDWSTAIRDAAPALVEQLQVTS